MYIQGCTSFHEKFVVYQKYLVLQHSGFNWYFSQAFENLIQTCK